VVAHDVCLHVGGGGGGLNFVELTIHGQGLDDVDLLVISQNLNKFKRLHRLNLVSWGRSGFVWPHVV
jgi:hypothetical protein